MKKIKTALIVSFVALFVLYLTIGLAAIPTAFGSPKLLGVWEIMLPEKMKIKLPTSDHDEKGEPLPHNKTKPRDRRMA